MLWLTCAMLDAYRSLLKRQEGQGMVEYGLIIALVAIAVIATLVLLGGKLNTLFTSVANAV